MSQSPADYEILTRQHYQDSAIATKYRAEYAGPLRLQTLPARIVAARERRIIQRWLEELTDSRTESIRKVLDLPCGTGKLAAVFSDFDFSVVAADISREMMDLAAQEYKQLPTFCGFVQTDASAMSFGQEEFDAAVCLRLLHRVPDSVRAAILAELHRIVRRFVIVSAGLDDSVQDLRRRVRRTLTGISTVPYPVTRRALTGQLLSAGLQPVRWAPVLPIMSSEWIVLVEKR